MSTKAMLSSFWFCTYLTRFGLTLEGQAFSFIISNGCCRQMCKAHLSDHRGGLDEYCSNDWIFAKDEHRVGMEISTGNLLMVKKPCRQEGLSYSDRCWLQ